MTRTVTVDRAELEAHGRARTDAGSTPVLVVLVDGTPYAVEDSCRHRGYSLADGVVRDGVITCPSHFWQYDLRSGDRHDNEGEGLPAYPCRLLDGVVEVDLPDETRPMSLREALLAHAREGSQQHAREGSQQPVRGSRQEEDA